MKYYFISQYPAHSGINKSNVVIWEDIYKNIFHFRLEINYIFNSCCAAIADMYSKVYSRTFEIQNYLKDNNFISIHPIKRERQDKRIKKEKTNKILLKQKWNAKKLLKDIGNLLFKAICCPFWIDMSCQKFLYFSLIESRKIGNVCIQCIPHSFPLYFGFQFVNMHQYICLGNACRKKS